MTRFPTACAALVLALGVHVAGSAWADDITARELADAVALSIDRNHYDPALGRTHADALRAAGARGEFDGLADIDAAAAAMTMFLRERDRHYAVRRDDANQAGAVRVESGDAPAGESAPTRRIVRRGGPQEPPIGRVETLDGAIGYVEVRAFAGIDFDDPADPTRHAIDEALVRLRGAKAIVLDLRGNRGGSPAMVGYLASAFVAEGTDIFNTFHSRRGTMSERPATWHARPDRDVALYLLVDRRTGSAAESFAYTLKHAGRATVVGTPTGGAANPGRMFALENGFAAFVPTGTPINPITRANWEAVGVQPDVATDGDALGAALALARDRG